MKITNKEGLPSGFYNACLRQYDREEGTYSITELLKGETAIILERRYEKEIEQDCAEMVWMVFGSAVHKVMEDHTVEDTQVSEMGLSGTFFGTKIKGHIDLYDAEKAVVCDYKTCSVWKIIFGDYEDWRKQLVGYAWLLEQNGLNAETGEIVAFMKDFKKRDSQNKPDYPEHPVKRIIFGITEDDIKNYEVNFLRPKLEKLDNLAAVPSEELPPCSPEDRWAKPDTFAVKKKGRKTALRVLETREDAEAWMENNGGDSIEERKGLDVRCKDYCSVCEFCPYWKEKYGNK